VALDLEQHRQRDCGPSSAFFFGRLDAAAVRAPGRASHARRSVKGIARTTGPPSTASRVAWPPFDARRAVSGRVSVITAETQQVTRASTPTLVAPVLKPDFPPRSSVATSRRMPRSNVPGAARGTSERWCAAVGCCERFRAAGHWGALQVAKPASGFSATRPALSRAMSAPTAMQTLACAVPSGPANCCSVVAAVGPSRASARRSAASMAAKSRATTPESVVSPSVRKIRSVRLWSGSRI
jgi:hypothetical protein